MSTFQTYTQRIDADLRWGLFDTSLQFEGRGSVLYSLHKLVELLDRLGVPYAIAGTLASFHHGYRRVTTNVNVLVSQEHPQLIHLELTGNGYQPPQAGSRNLYDIETGVLITFLTTGDYPGDGKPKAIAFPNPVDVRVEKNGLWFLSLPSLIDLKLASGISNPIRGKDLADVQELISIRNLDESLVPQLHPYVRAKYIEIVELIRNHPVIPE